jgi:ABC-type transporter Mla subunit MlaD
MPSEKGYFRLGLFVIAGFAVLIGAVILIGVSSGKGGVITMETYLLESAQGLFKGSDVKIRGVTIGQVTSIQLASLVYTKGDLQETFEKGTYVVVTFDIDDDLISSDRQEEIEKRIDVAVKRGCRTRMAQAGFTGPTYLELVFVNPERNPIPEVSWKPKNHYIPSSPSTMLAITQGLEEIILSLKRAKLAQLIDNSNDTVLALKAALEKIDTKNISDNTVALLAEARQTNDKVKAILNNPDINKTLTNFQAMSASLKDLTGSQELFDFARDLPKITGKLKSTSNRLDELLHDKRLDEAVGNLNGTLKGSDEAVLEARRSLKEISILLASQKEDIAGLVSALKRVADNAAAITADVKDSPSRLIFSQPPAKKEPGK